MMGDFGEAKDKWVCPNDRELSLRAKLRKGWCVKTHCADSFTKPEQLNDSEQEMIINVIRRAENIDKSEQERVGRLVERLDNMKKNAMGNGSSQCVLCADEFGILGASPLVCNDCKKAVCTKCSVDTISSQKEPLWLCKICAETRETWKKSGAWFYKGLPKHVLPGRKQDFHQKYASAARPPTEPTSNPVCSYNAWLQTKGRSGSDKDYTDSSDDDLKCGKLSRRAVKPLSDSESGESSVMTSDSNQSMPKSSQQHRPSSPYVISETSSGYTLSKEAIEDVPEVVPVTYLQHNEGRPDKYSPSRNHGPQDETWYKSKRDEDELEQSFSRKSYKGHVRRDSLPNSENYCNGRTRIHKPRNSPHQPPSELYQDKSSAYHDIIAQDDAAVTENTSKKKKKWIKRLKESKK